jgi:hypothetical protein
LSSKARVHSAAAGARSRPQVEGFLSFGGFGRCDELAIALGLLTPLGELEVATLDLLANPLFQLASGPSDDSFSRAGGAEIDPSGSEAFLDMLGPGARGQPSDRFPLGLADHVEPALLDENDLFPQCTLRYVALKATMTGRWAGQEDCRESNNSTIRKRSDPGFFDFHLRLYFRLLRLGKINNS